MHNDKFNEETGLLESEIIQNGRMKFLENCDFDEANLEISEEVTEGKNGKLLVTIEAIHPGETRNYRIYPEDKLKGSESLGSGAHSFTRPYNKPMLLHHDTSCTPVGRIVSAEYGMSKKTGKECIIIKAEIPEGLEAKRVRNGIWSTVSVGGSCDSLICNICGKDIIKEGFCGHWRGDTYEGNVCKYIIGNVWFDECSFVNVPADENAGIIDMEEKPAVPEESTEEVENNDEISEEAETTEESTNIPVEKSADTLVEETQDESVEETIEEDETIEEESLAEENQTEEITESVEEIIEETVNPLQESLDTTINELNDTRNALAEANNNIEAITKAKELLEKEITTLNEKVETLNNEIAKHAEEKELSDNTIAEMGENIKIKTEENIALQKEATDNINSIKDSLIKLINKNKEFFGEEIDENLNDDNIPALLDIINKFNDNLQNRSRRAPEPIANPGLSYKTGENQSEILGVTNYESYKKLNPKAQKDVQLQAVVSLFKGNKKN